MARNYPETIPAQYAKGEYKAAYVKGWAHGHGIACHNVPTLGETYRTDMLGKVKADAENIRDIHQWACFEAESAGRDYSPFEFTAHEFNSSDDTEGVWEAFEAGSADAIFADLAEYTDADYGIETVEA